MVPGPRICCVYPNEPFGAVRFRFGWAGLGNVVSSGGSGLNLDGKWDEKLLGG